jgi:O-antigen ligase
MSPYTSELFEFNKMLFIYLIAILLIFLWLANGLFEKQFFIKKTIFNWPIFIFLLSQILATFFSIDPYTSFIGYYGRFNGGLLSLLAFLALFYILIVFFDFTKLEKLLKISIFASLITMLWGLPGKFGFDLSCFFFVGQLSNNCWTDQFRPAERMFSTLGQPNWLGAYLAINFFLGFYFLLRHLVYQQKNTKNTIITLPLLFYCFYLILNFLSIIFTRSRSALVAVLGGILILVGYLILADKKGIAIQLKKIYLTVLLICFGFLILGFKTGVEKVDYWLNFSFLKPLNQQSLNQPALKNQPVVTNSLDIRKIVWQGALALGKKYPIFGTGPETFAYAYYFVRPASHNLTSEWDYLYNKAHNEYLNYLATTGLVGLIAYLLLIFLVIILFLKKLKIEVNPRYRYFYLCLFLSYWTILITNFFGFSTTTINLFFYLLPGFYLIADQMHSRVQTKLIFFFNDQAKFNYYFLQPLIWILAVSVGFLALKWLVFYYWADLKYAQANTLVRHNRFQEAANNLNEALRMHYEHVYEDRFANVLANLAYAASYQKEKTTAEKLVALAKYYNNRSLQASPKNSLYWKTQAKNQYLFYKISLKQQDLIQAVAALRKAQELAPTDPKIPYSLALFYSLLYDETKDKTQMEQWKKLSLLAIKQAINLKPNSRDNYFFQGQLLKKYKYQKEAKAVFEKILRDFNPQDEEIKKELQNL